MPGPDTSLFPGSKKATRPKNLSARGGIMVDTEVILADGRKVTGWYDIYRGTHIYFRHPEDEHHWRKVSFNVEPGTEVPYRVIDHMDQYLVIDFRPVRWDISFDFDGDDTKGYEVAEYFWGRDTFEDAERATTKAEAEKVLADNYKGPDTFGIGVVWEVEEK